MRFVVGPLSRVTSFGIGREKWFVHCLVQYAATNAGTRSINGCTAQHVATGGGTRCFVEDTSIASDNATTNPSDVASTDCCRFFHQIVI